MEFDFEFKVTSCLLNINVLTVALVKVFNHPCFSFEGFIKPILLRLIGTLASSWDWMSVEIAEKDEAIPRKETISRGLKGSLGGQ